MRIVSYRSDRGDRAGVRDDQRVVDAADLLGEEAIGVRRLLADDRLDELLERFEQELSGATRRAEVTPLADLELLPPVPDPDKVICIGLNYSSHAAEAGIDPPQSPTFFAKFRNALAAPGATVELPAASEKVDYEAEVAVVVGRRCKQIDAGRADEAIAGYMLLNDLSARDLQFGTPQWMPGKVFDGSAPCGPAVVTPEEAGPHDAISFWLELNGERMQEASTSDLIFSAPELVSRLSHLMTLEPGDIISTGTPSGVGSTRDPRVWLRPGDRIEIGSPTLGVLVTTIAG